MSDQVRSTIQKKDDKGIIRHGGEWLAIWSDPESVKTEEEKRVDRERLETVDQYRQQLAASARSLSGHSELEVKFGNTPPGPDLLVLHDFRPDDLDLPAARGECDAKASAIRYHDRSIHRKLAPTDPVEKRFFDLLENARCQGLAGRAYHGVAENLAAWQYQRLDRSDLLNAHLASLLPLSEGLDMVLRDHFCGLGEASIQTAGMRMWNRWLRDKFGHRIEALSREIANQKAYGELALDFIGELFEELPSRGQRISRFSDRHDSHEQGVVDDSFRRETDALEEVTHFEPGEWLLDDSDARHQPVVNKEGVKPVPYRAYTTSHDREVNAQDISDRGELRSARRELDRKRAEYRLSFARLVARLQRRLQARQMRRWEFDLEEGLIDASKLDRVVLNPGFSHAYKVETESRFRDTVVTLLIDNSGSMRGKPIELAVLVSDMLAAGLERCSISTEILGFTTSAWKGGNSALDWARDGRPPEPGRLNDLLHIVYKNADTPLRRARDSLCAMLSPALLKENIDGEALLWAARRLMRRPEARKVLVVISDGAPVDQATIQENSDKQILDRHLRETIRNIERETPIELSAIGIRHDVTTYYTRAAHIRDVDDLGSALIAMLDEIFLAG